MNADAASRDIGDILVIGGGRWARVIIGVLLDLIPSGHKVSALSPRGSSALQAWMEHRGLGGRIEVLQQWPQAWPRQPAPGRLAIVANAVRDHAGAIEQALGRGYHVLCEKPLTPTLQASQAMVELARRVGFGLFSSNVLLYARYLEVFRNALPDPGTFRNLAVVWADAKSEVRYGEAKSYDPATSVVLDVMPHIVCLLSVTAPGQSWSIRSVEPTQGGATVSLELSSLQMSARVCLARNAPRRRRVITVETLSGTFQLDFSQEPGVITDPDGRQSIADPEWGRRQSPLTAMLHDVLAAAAGESPADRLTTAPALCANQLVDSLMPAYRAWQQDFVRGAAVEGAAVDPAARDYALAELSQQLDRPFEPGLLQKPLRVDSASSRATHMHA